MMMVKAMGMANEKYNNVIYTLVLLHEKFLQFDWLREVVFQLYLKYMYLHVNITNLLWVVV